MPSLIFINSLGMPLVKIYEGSDGTKYYLRADGIVIAREFNFIYEHPVVDGILTADNKRFSITLLMQLKFPKFNDRHVVVINPN